MVKMIHFVKYSHPCSWDHLFHWKSTNWWSWWWGYRCRSIYPIDYTTISPYQLSFNICVCRKRCSINGSHCTLVCSKCALEKYVTAIFVVHWGIKTYFHLHSWELLVLLIPMFPVIDVLQYPGCTWFTTTSSYFPIKRVSNIYFPLSSLLTKVEVQCTDGVYLMCHHQL